MVASSLGGNGEGGDVCGSKKRLVDGVMEAIESVQRSVRDIGDLLLDDIQLALIDENIAVEFIQNKEFLKTLTKEKIGYLKLRGSPKSFHLQLLSSLTSLQPGGCINCGICGFAEEKEFFVSVKRNEKPIEVSLSGETFSFIVRQDGEYIVSVKWFGQHVLGSPLTLPVTKDLSRQLAKLGLAPINSQQYIQDTDGPGLEIGAECYAKWSEDGVWYRGIIETLNGDQTYNVLFFDYGNSDCCLAANIVTNVNAIPNEDPIDENVETVLVIGSSNTNSESFHTDAAAMTVAQEKDNDNLNRVSIDEMNPVPVKETERNEPEIPDSGFEGDNKNKNEEGNSLQIEKNLKMDRFKFQLDDRILAKWSEDGVWYNASIIKITNEGVRVMFSDYGNEDLVKRSDIVKSAAEIPVNDDYDVHVINSDDEDLTTTPNINDATVTMTQIDDLVDSDVSKHLDQVLNNHEIEDKVEHVVSPDAKISGSNSKIIETKDFEASSATIEILVKPEEICASENPTEASDSRKSNVEDDRRCEIKNASKSATNNETSSTSKSNSPDLNLNEVMGNSGRFQIGDFCFARWEEDQVWYNAKVVDISARGDVTVNFTDYGNADKVLLSGLVSKCTEIPIDQTVDENIDMKSEHVLETAVEEAKSNFLMFLNANDGSKALTAKKKIIIKNLNGPVGVGILVSNFIAVVCRNDDAVYKFSKTGNPLGKIEISDGERFERPTDICVLRSGDFIIRDSNGLHRFDADEKYLGRIGEVKKNKYFGVAEDKKHIITINCNHDKNFVNTKSPTKTNGTDIFFFDKSSLELVKRIEMATVLDISIKDRAQCRYLTYDRKDGKLYVVDMGLDCIHVFTINDECERFGSSGDKIGEFKRPAGLAIDNIGTIAVVDSGNNRLQLLDKNWNFSGVLKVDTPFARPSGICYDQENSELYVSNFGARGNVTIYQLKK